MRTLTTIVTRRKASLNDFLAQKPTFNHIVIGNPAGDADSIVSSLSLAYVDHLTGWNPKRLPVVSIPRADLPLRRETVLLLEMIQVSTLTLVCLDDLPSPLTTSSITLVDHNKLQFTQLDESKVVEILDHHMDEQAHPIVPPEYRNIAFKGSSALVASTCTLVVERFLQRSPQEIPADLAFVLLGVILLDTVNMSDSAGKWTARDRAAVDALVSKTDWSTLARLEGTKLFFTSSAMIDTTALYEFLNKSKFDIKFWKSLAVQDALRLDYKQFSSASGEVFGVASVLLPIADVLIKPRIDDELNSFMSGCKIPIFVILSLVVEDGVPRRSILICGPVDDVLVNSISDFLALHESLLLKEIKCTASATLTMRQFSQGNAMASRKQIVPIMMEFFESVGGNAVT